MVSLGSYHHQQPQVHVLSPSRHTLKKVSVAMGGRGIRHVNTQGVVDGYELSNAKSLKAE